MSVNSSPGRQFSLSIVAALVGAVLTSGASVANADTASAEGVPALAVKYKNGELTTREGSLRLYTRITNAASEVCAATNPGVAAVVRYQACKRAAIDRAVNELKSPQLAAIHSDHSHKG
jgi:UrcA family protein